MADKQALRLAVIAALTTRAPERLGRTAFMKLMFFLQTIRNVALGYEYRLYTYGPYDAQVLDDLSLAEAMGVVCSRSFQWPGGTGYTVDKGPNLEPTLDANADALKAISPDLDWVVSEFGSRSAGDLEVASTIVYADRTADGRKLPKDEIVRVVHQIKPHHSEAKIAAEYDNLSKKGLV